MLLISQIWTFNRIHQIKSFQDNWLAQRPQQLPVLPCVYQSQQNLYHIYSVKFRAQTIFLFQSKFPGRFAGFTLPCGGGEHTHDKLMTGLQVMSFVACQGYIYASCRYTSLTTAERFLILYFYWTVNVMCHSGSCISQSLLNIFFHHHKIVQELCKETKYLLSSDSFAVSK